MNEINNGGGPGGVPGGSQGGPGVLSDQEPGAAPASGAAPAAV